MALAELYEKQNLAGQANQHYRLVAADMLKKEEPEVGDCGLSKDLQPESNIA